MSKTHYWYTEMYTGIYLPVKVDVIRMKKLYISEINSVYTSVGLKEIKNTSQHKVFIEQDSVPQKLIIANYDYVLPQPQSSS